MCAPRVYDLLRPRFLCDLTDRVNSIVLYSFFYRFYYFMWVEIEETFENVSRILKKLIDIIFKSKYYDWSMYHFF